MTYYTNRKLTEGICIGLHKLTSDNYISYHWHEFYEIELVLDGTAKHVVNDREYTLKPGDMHMITLDDFHSISIENHLTVASVTFFPNALPTHLIEKILPLGFSSVCLTKQQLETMSREMEFLLSQYENFEENSDRFLLKNAFERVLLLFLHYLFSKGQPESVSKQPQSLQKALAFVRQNYSRQITLEDAAKVAGMETTYFSRYFNRNMGVRFVQYLNRVRCSVAAAYLSATDMSIEKIATLTGYTSASYFSKVFHSIYDTSPALYRSGFKA